MRSRAALAALLLALPAAAQDACGGADAPCTLAEGDYHYVAPPADAPVPAVVFLHGAGGTGRGVLRLGGTIGALTARGYAVIAPDGQAREGRGGRFWSFRPGLGAAGRDDGAFLAEVVADAVARHGVDPERVVLAGFSNGAFLVNYLACRTPGAFAAYAPVSGGFWEPMPEACAGPVRLLHTHGWRDPTVPLEGRPLRGGAFLQGDVFAGLAIWRTANGCARPDPTGFRETGAFQRRFWDCAEGSALEMALFAGGHGIPDGWAEMLVDWFEAAPG